MVSRLEPDVTMNAADLLPSETIAAHEHTSWQSVDHQTFFAAIDIPPTPTERLRTAFARHGKTIISR
jgi:uncharacterized protein (DUF1778 family)